MIKIIMRAAIVALCGALLTAEASFATAHVVVHSTGLRTSVAAGTR
jgi:hypothetical protein